MYYKPWLHPNSPVPRPVYLLWSVLQEMQYSPLKIFWVGERGVYRHKALYVPAVISYRPGIEHRLAIDFAGSLGKWNTGNYHRAEQCARLGMQYVTLKRTATRPEMITLISSTIRMLRGEL